jgi:uroporphyrinogen decarboxylase
MNSRQRVLTTLEHRQPDRVPFDLWAVPEVWERLQQHLGVADRESVLSHFDVDLRYVEGPAFVGQDRTVHPDGSVEDLWGVRRKLVEVTGDGYTWRYKEVVAPPLAAAKTVADIEAYPSWPSADWWDYSTVAEQCRAHPGRAVVIKGNRLDRTAQLKTMMYLRGMEQIFVDLRRNPELVEAMIAKIQAYYLDYNERVFVAADGAADIFMMGDDFGMQQGPMMRMEMWQRFFRPGFRRYIEQAHQHGLKVMHHSCGSVRHLMDEFIGAGLDILQSLQPRARDMDLAQLKEAYGQQLCFHGGVDIQQTLPFGTPGQVTEEVQALMAAGKPGGGYIAGTAHNLLPDVPTENIIALLEAYREHGAY